MSRTITTASPYLPPIDDYLTHLQQIWDSKWITNGGMKHEQLQQSLQEHLECNFLSLFTNGHLALETALKALQLTGEVITTPFTFVSTAHAIVNAGCTPVFCDIEEETYTIDVSQIERHITEKTSAIVAVHVYGNCCDLEAIEAIATKHNLKVIYDAAHAFHVLRNGKSIATAGDMTMYSFHATKVFHTIEGGAVVCNNQALYERIQAMKNFGLFENSAHYIGTNGKMSEFQAAMGLCNLEVLPDQIDWRSKLFNRYMERLQLVDSIRLPKLQPSITPNYAYFPIRVNDGLRDKLDESLTEKGILARKYFYPIVSHMPSFNHQSIKGNTKVAEKVADEVLVLPLHTNLTLEQIDLISEAIIQWNESLKVNI